MPIASLDLCATQAKIRVKKLQTKVCPYLFPKHCAISDLEEEIMDSEKEEGGREGRLKKDSHQKYISFQCQSLFSVLHVITSHNSSISPI